jgi:hypothetical protein
MRKRNQINGNVFFVSTLLVGFTVIASGCCSLRGGCDTTRTEVVKQAPVEYQVRNIPGVVEYVWEEPMVDVVDVPPGLDPEGHYYRPGHQEVIEIRQGRWQYHRRDQGR